MRSEVRGQIAEVESFGFDVADGEGVHLCNLTSSL
jgi:hypothetical protein